MNELLALAAPLKPFFPSIFICVFFIILRFVYKNWLLAFLHYLTDKYDIALVQEIISAAERPINFLLNVVNVTTTVAWLPQAEVAQFIPFITAGFMERLAVVTDHIQRSTLIYSIFWCLYNLSDATHSLMLVLLQRMGLKPGDEEISIENQKASEAISTIFSAVLHFLIILIGMVTIAREWGYDASAFLASLSIGSAAVAFAAKDALANIFGSLVIILGKPFLAGDWIKVNGIEGIVEKINMRSTVIRTFPQELVHIPNSLMTNVPITNFTKRKKRRLDFTLGLTYATTKAQMEATVSDIRQYFAARPQQFDGSDIRVHFTSYGDSSLNISATVYVLTTNTMEYLDITQQINLDMLEIMQKNGVGCAFPSTSVYFENALRTQSPAPAPLSLKEK